MSEMTDITAPTPAVGDGGPDMVQLLTPEGQRVANAAAADYAHYVEDLTDEDMRGLYRDLVLIRRVDTEATALQRQGELGIWASLLGQEAAQVGSGRAMKKQDYAFPTYREHGVAWCRGVDPLNLLGLFRGVNHGGWDPNEKNFHLYTIVIGAQTLHATGYAMGIQRDGAVGTGDQDRDAAVIAYFGDGATSQGDVSESFVFAAVNNAPIVFFCQNNQWAISEPNDRQTRIPLYQRARGFGFPGVRVDGNDVLAVYAVTKHALEEARSGQGPFLVEAWTYRMGAHTTSDDPTKYRVSAEVEVWKLRDPIERLKAYLAHEGKADHDFFDEVDREADELAAHVREGCLTMPDPTPQSMFDNVYVESHPRIEEERPRVRRLPEQLRGRGGAGMSSLTIAKALTAGLRRAMEDDPKVILMGEDIGKLGGVFRVTEGLQKDFGEERVMDTPLAEAGIVGTAIGLALRGYRPVVEIQFDGFVYPAFDHIVSQVAKMRARSLGFVSLPMVIRIPVGGGIGAVEHHSESNEAYFAHTAGLRVVTVSNPQDAYWGIQQAIATDDPVIFYEPKRRYWDKGEVDESASTRGLFEAAVLKEGTDCTVVAYGPMVKTCLQAAQAAEDEGKSIEVVDLRSLSPLDLDTVVASVEKTGRLVVVHEASTNLGLGAEVAAAVTQRAFYSLEAPVLRVGGYNLPYPPSRLEEEFLPDLDRVLDTVDRALAF